MNPTLSTLPAIHGTLFVVNHAINCGHPLFLFRSTIVDNNRGRLKNSFILFRSTETIVDVFFKNSTIVDVLKTHNRGRLNWLFCSSDFIYILLINSKFSILHHLPTCSVTSLLQVLQGFWIARVLLLPIALKEMDITAIARQSLQASSVG